MQIPYPCAPLVDLAEVEESPALPVAIRYLALQFERLT
jgi:hypothetical protein